MASTSAQRTDVLIGGAGFAGLGLAIALKQALGPSFAVTVADPALGRPSTDARASAIVAAARRLFETIGVWDAVAADAQPILDMRITDSRLGDAVRPVFLTFDGDVEPGEPFAHMVENPPLLAALAAKAKELGVDLRPAAVTDFTLASPGVSAERAPPDGRRRTTPRMAGSFRSHGPCAQPTARAALTTTVFANWSWRPCFVGLWAVVTSRAITQMNDARPSSSPRSGSGLRVWAREKTPPSASHRRTACSIVSVAPNRLSAPTVKKASRIQQ